MSVDAYADLFCEKNTVLIQNEHAGEGAGEHPSNKANRATTAMTDIL
jgi:hypothetical protein